MTTLTKEELVSAIAEVNGYPRNRSVELVETILELIKSKLAAGETRPEPCIRRGNDAAIEEDSDV